jgi:protein disulfide-isomerase A6
MTPAQFEAACSRDGAPSVVVFAAGWCPHCRELKPTFERLAEHFPGLAWVDLQDERGTPLRGSDRLTKKYNVQGYPTILNIGRSPPEEYAGDRGYQAMARWLDGHGGRGHSMTL